MERELNLALPGNPRTKPKDLRNIFGYDKLVCSYVAVELATMRVLHTMGHIPNEDYALLTPDVEESLYAITTSEIDVIERDITRHDIRALVMRMQQLLPEPLRRFVHVPLTSYDVIDTGRVLQFVKAHDTVVRPKTLHVMRLFSDLVGIYHDQIQIGRTHGQHALPITVGFWLATILSRVYTNFLELERCRDNLVGKLSGAVGANNAQVGLALTNGGGISFEQKVLSALGVRPAKISTQIVPPESMAYYLHACVMLSATFGQFGCDGRHLMRTEIGELSEPFEREQSGSSTMAHKRNPMTLENIEGTFKKNVAEYVKVFFTLVSEHQRDLVGSTLMRDFPTIVVNLVEQLDRLLRKGADDPRLFLARIGIDRESCMRNFHMQSDRVLAEPMYLALQLYGYAGDAHRVVNHKAMPMVGTSDTPTLFDALDTLATHDHELNAAWQEIPQELKQMFRDPRGYTGHASRKALKIKQEVDEYLKPFSV